MIGVGVGKVIESKNVEFPVETVVVGSFGWRTHIIVTEAMTNSSSQNFRKVPSGISMSKTLGILGLTGLTAYFGFLDICQPKAGETVFVNTAAGAVGNVVGQIAKLKGCHVVGCAGTEAKLEYLRELGFDDVFNYKTADLDKTLKELCPKGIDCFFDNVGGKMFDITLGHMNKYGRISLCGAISTYNSTDPANEKTQNIHMVAISKELKIQGFLAPSFYGRYEEGVGALVQWMKEGMVKDREHVVEGFDNMPKAFIGLFSGDNIGKTVVKIQ